MEIQHYNPETYSYEKYKTSRDYETGTIQIQYETDFGGVRVRVVDVFVDEGTGIMICGNEGVVKFEKWMSSK